MRHRFLFDKLIDHLRNKRFSIVVGARQTGKSTLLRQVRDYCTSQGFSTISLNMENKDYRTVLDDSPENLFQYISMPKEGKVFVFIDEIQKLKDPSNFLKLLWDEHSDKLKVIATVSSAFYIDGKFNDSLAGRKKIFNLYTCSFEEYLFLGEQDGLLSEYRRIKDNPEAKSLQLIQLQNAFYQFLQYGGYPEVVTTTDESEKREILTDLRDSFVKKDMEDAGVKDEDSFYKLMRMLASQTGDLVNTSELAKMLHIKEETVAKYMKVMEKSFHIVLIKPFFRNISKELVKMPMVYFLDSGMRNSLTGNFLPYASNPNIGTIWENQVLRLLADKYGIEEIRFWRTTEKKEVDFVLPMQNPPLAFEVKKNSVQARASKYRTFTNAYPEFVFDFLCLEPFTEELIRIF